MTRMSSMSVFNWDAQASQKGVERAADRIVKAIGDEGRNSQKIVEAVKAGSEKVVDAVGKIKATTNVAHHQPVPDSVSTVHRGLVDMSKATAHIADYLASHPDEMSAATQATESISKEFGALVEAVSAFDEGDAKLRGMVGEMAKVQDWVATRFPNGGSVPVNNAGRVVHSFNELWQ